MGFKRAQWRSGLTYERECDQCHTVIRYMDDKLDFRPWFADGFIYCPICNKPLRHNERFAINRPDEPTFVDLTAKKTSPQESNASAQFCAQCGTRFSSQARFCSKCGAKREQ